jgi:hypothetical protein
MDCNFFSALGMDHLNIGRIWKDNPNQKLNLVKNYSNPLIQPVFKDQILQVILLV